MELKDITLIVVPRDRFSMAREALESLYANTRGEFSLIYVDGHAPHELRDWLRRRQRSDGFRLIEVPHYCSPNVARNLALRELRTPLAVFVDNDVTFEPGWLEALLRCTLETGADVVAPLVCEGYPPFTTIHTAGGEYVPPEELERFHAQAEGQRELREKQHLLNEPLARWRDRLSRTATGFVEMHCLLVRRSLLERFGPQPFDEAMQGTREHLDFCMSVRAAGGTIWVEPRAVVNFMLPNPARPLRPYDLPYFLLRWSDLWQHRSLDYFVDKWRLGRTDLRKRYLSTSYRREDWLRSCLQQLPLLGPQRRFVELALKGLRRPEKFINRRYAAWYSRRHGSASSA